MEKLKNLHKSWTIWFNTAMGAVITGLPMVVEQLPQLQAYLPEDVYKMLMLIAIGGNIALRFKTNGSLADK